MDVHLVTICYALLSLFCAVLLLTSGVYSERVNNKAAHLRLLEDNGDYDDYQYEGLENQLKEKSKPNQTSTTIKPVTTTPAAVAEKGTFSIKSSGKTCLKATFKASFTVKYASKRSGEKKFYNAVINLPENVVISGSCGKNESLLGISWFNNTFSLSIRFGTLKGERRRRDLDTKLPGWSATTVVFTFDTSHDTYFQSPTNARKHIAKAKPGERIFAAERHQCYFCKSKQKLILKEYYKNDTINNVDIDHVDVDIWKVQVQAFDIPANEQFSQKLLCEADVIESLPKKNFVPIIVAGCLAILIIIVIVAYFISKNYGQSAYRPMS